MVNYVSVANLRYLYQGEYLGRGRPRKYTGKVDLTDYRNFEPFTKLTDDVVLYTAVVWSMSLKRPIRLVYLLKSSGFQARTDNSRWAAVGQHNSDTDFVFSMASYKRRALNYYLLERFIEQLDLEPTLIKSHPNYHSLYDYGTITA